MTNEQLKRTAAVIRELADEIERGDWGTVTYRIENDLVDKPRTWRDGGHYRGKDLVGRDVTICLRKP